MYGRVLRNYLIRSYFSPLEKRRRKMSRPVSWPPQLDTDDPVERRLNEAGYTRAPGRLKEPNTVGTPPPDPVTETIRTRFLMRQRVGWTRYGIGLGREDFT